MILSKSIQSPQEIRKLDLVSGTNFTAMFRHAISASFRFTVRRSYSSASVPIAQKLKINGDRLWYVLIAREWPVMPC